MCCGFSVRLFFVEFKNQIHPCPSLIFSRAPRRYIPLCIKLILELALALETDKRPETNKEKLCRRISAEPLPVLRFA